jgi:LuxR family maltose regulon positive regulatory protein
VSTAILVTKLFIPPPRPELVHRLGLIKRLNKGLDRKLTLISAPAGFGKTTLVSAWLGNLKSETEGSQTTYQISWLSLDAGDNDPIRFLTYLVTALRQAEEGNISIGGGAMSMLQAPQPPPVDAILTSLINDIATIPGNIIFVLDDYHLIEEQPNHAAIVYLLEHLPPQLHLVIATREDPRLNLPRLRARNQLTELRAADLRFTPSESAEFLNQVMGLKLSTEDIAVLETRTEGWIAGLQLAAISMRRRTNTTSFIQSFSGSHRLVLDYLLEEVLTQQLESVQTFLLQTAILDRLTGSLCDALTDQDNGQETLDTLERANLFIVPLDDERCCFRYHHLFGDLLRQRLCNTQPEQVSVLHNRASVWYEKNRFYDDAIEHALHAEDFQRSANLIEEQADALWQRGEHGKLRRWLEDIPVNVFKSKLQLCIFRAYYLQSSGQHFEGEQLIQEIEKALEISSDSESESPQPEWLQLQESKRVKLRGRLVVVQALIDAINGNVPGIIQHANQALENLPEQDWAWRSMVAFALGDAYSFLGDMAASYQARFKAVRACEAAGNIFYIIVANLKLASTLREQGELLWTLDVCQQQMQSAHEYGLSKASPVGCLLALWGEVLAELNDLDGAIQQAQNGVEIAERGGNLQILGFSYLYLMRVLLSKGDLAGAEEIIRKVAHLDRETNVPPWLTNQMATWQARIWLIQDELGAASQWAEECGLSISGEPKILAEVDFLLLFGYIMLARILIAQNRLDEATNLLQGLFEPAEKGGRVTRVIEILVLQALALQAQGDTDQAVTNLERALILAESRGFVRIFVDEGPPMSRLLYEALNREIKPEYVSRLLKAFPIDVPEQTDSSRTQGSQSGLLEPLSERELNVLQLIAEGLTNPEIAARLVLSLHTIKTHTRNIYGKLDAHNRTEAVAKARVLGILPFT